MKVIKIDKNEWAGGLEKLRSAYELIGPVKEKFYHAFQSLESGQQPDMDYINTRVSPKYVIYPQSELILECSLNENDEDYKIYKEPEKEYKAKAILGIRPCDADSFSLVRRNFDTEEYKDPYWLRAYESTTFVGLACDQPCPTCFCSSAGSGPYSGSNLDILLADNGDHYLARVLTEKGEKLAAAAGWSQEAGDEADQQIEQKKQEAESAIQSSVNTDKLASQSLLDLYEATNAIWEKEAFSCINCGTCTFVCPTCWCFDVQDEVAGKKGYRIRNWDSCMYPLFTMHASGHNPRGTKVDRLRQRFMHKLKYYVDKYENGIQCTGCGRCVQLCPVNIDIRRICNMLNSYDPESCTCEVTAS